MARSQTPESLARRMAKFVYTELMSCPQGYIGVSDPVTLDKKRILLFVEGFNPKVALLTQLKSDARWRKAVAKMDGAQQMEEQARALKDHLTHALEPLHDMYAEIVGLLRGGAKTRDVQQYISDHQCWPCFAITATKKDLEREMTVRYALGRCEVDFGHVDLPDAVLVSCRMIPREWRANGTILSV